ncbi:MAG: PEP-CTERM sorting domain-containing protein [Phycisphaerae bacterium]|nr:PEP-CTERM sorting domain-containing protein [Phycisphaerae bacterium]
MKNLMCMSLILAVSPVWAVVVMTGNDAMGTSSFNSAGKWDDGLAPSAGKDYSTVGYLLRTPSTAGSYTFAGDSLTVGGGTGGGSNPFLTNGSVNNNALLNKTPSNPTITVNNLILDAGYIRDGMGSGDTWTIAGAIYVTNNGGGFANQCRLNVDSVISGSGTLYIADNGSGEASRTTYINSSLNTYNGSIKLVGSSAARSRITFSDNSRMNFVIGAAGISNSISGTGTAVFNGDFYFDLTGASFAIGDSWTIASVVSQTFGDTFTVAGFTDIDGTLWRASANGAVYEFSEATGTLSVVIPEPATLCLLALGAVWMRRK